MKLAYRCEEEFTPDGKRLVRRERVVGGIVIWGIVVLAAMASGYSFTSSNLWAYLKP